jgi:hypothetical protein
MKLTKVCVYLHRFTRRGDLLTLSLIGIQIEFFVLNAYIMIIMYFLVEVGILPFRFGMFGLVVVQFAKYVGLLSQLIVWILKMGFYWQVIIKTVRLHSYTIMGVVS